MHTNNHLRTRFSDYSRGLALATGLAAIMVLGGSPAHADLRDDIARCAALSHESERLTCFDTVAAAQVNAHNVAADAAITALQREFRFDTDLMTGPMGFQVNVSGNQVVSRNTAAAREVESILRRVQKVIGGTDDWRASVIVHGGQVTLSRGQPYSGDELLAQARMGIARTGLPKDRYSVEIGPNAQPVLWDDGRVRSTNENIEIIIDFGQTATR
jgi:hypothetical protein